MQNQKFKGKGKQFILALAAILLVMGVVCGVVLNSNKMHVSKETPIKVKVLGITENVTSGSTAKIHEDGEKIEEREDKQGTDGNNTEAGEQVESTEVSQIAGKKPENAVITIGDVNYASRNHTIKLELDGTDNEKVANSTLTINDIVVLVNETPVSATKSFEIENEDLNDGKNGRKYVLVLTNVPGDGRLSVTIPANTLVDEAGNQNDEINSTFDEEIIIDNTAPTKPTYAATYADNSAYTSGTWTNKDVYTTISTEEASSGVEEIQYSLDQSTWTKLNFTSGALTQSGTTWSGKEPWSKTDGKNDTIYFRAIDNVGNVSEISDLFNIKYDTSAPTLSLTKETYQEGFDGWKLPEGASIDNDGVLTMTQAGTVGNKYYRTGNEKWYITFDGYTGTASSQHPGAPGSAGPGDGGIYNGTEYVDNNYTSTNAQNGYPGNGYAPSLPLNTWSNDFSFNGYSGYGGSIEYVVPNFKTGIVYSQPPVKIRNFKMHGQLFEEFYNISLRSNGTNSNIVKTKWLGGEKTVANFASAGENVTNNEFSVTENGIYTVYVEDEAGNGAVSTIEVTKIDKTAPIIEANAKFNGASISFTAKDIAPNEKEAPSGVVGYQITDSNTEPTSGWTNVVVPEVTTVDGKKQTSQTINITNSGLTAGTHYIWVIDAVGHKTSKEINVYYTIAFNAGEGITSQGTETKEVNSATLPDIEIPTKTGYDFKGYFTEINGGGTQYYGPDGKAVKENDFTQDRILYAKWEGAKYTVTANANGGTISATSGWTGTGETVTKQVTYNSSYGALPTAENVSRAGYTFKGWNGKNLFDEESILMAINGAAKENNHYVFTFLDSYNKYGKDGNMLPLNGFKANTSYTLTINGYVSQVVEQYGGLVFRFHFTDDTNYDVKINNLTENTINYTTPNNKTISYITVTYGSGGAFKAYISSIQLEEGTTATPYEPYYITTETPVTIASNHNINAIWEGNPYTVHFDKNDSQEKPAVGEMADQEFVYDQAQNLTANEFVRIGYTFKGWNTKADGTGTNYTDKQSVSNLIATANGIVNLYAKWEEANATFVTGQTFNTIAKKLAGNLEATADVNDTAITQIKYASIGSGDDKISLEKLKEIKAQAVNSDATIDANTKYVKVSDDTLSNTPIYVWFENNKLYWFSEDDTPSLNLDASNMFRQFTALQNIPELNKIDTSKATTMNWLFHNCSSIISLDLSNFNTSLVTSMRSIFQGCSTLTELDLSHFNTSNVASMYFMFHNCNALENVNLTSFNTQNVTTMYSMFGNCTALTTLNLNGFNTNNVTNMKGMFYGCTGLTNLNLSSFNTSNVTTMEQMFMNCSSLTTLDLSGFNTGSVQNMENMFQGCRGLTTLDISNFNTSEVTTMRAMFMSCAELTQLDLRNFNTSKVQSMWFMFNGCTKLTTIYATDSFVTTALTNDAIGNGYAEGHTNSTYLFYNCPALVGGSGTAYNSSNINADYAWIDGKIDSTTSQARPGYFTNHYHIVFNKNSTKATGEMATQNIPFGKRVQLSTLGFNRSGGNFLGWSTTETGNVVFSATDYMEYDLAGIKAIAQDTADDKNITLTLYAQWDVTKYKVHFDKNAESATGTMEDQNFEYNEQKTLTPNAYTRPGYTFKEWNKNANGSGQAFADGESVVDLTLTNGATVNLYAQWQAKPYTVHFNKNDSQEKPAVGEMADQEFVYEQTQNLTANEFVRIGYTFKGWNTKADGTGTNYADSASVTNITGDDEVTLYAKWEVANATFVTGQNFNAIAKKLAGNLNATYTTANSSIKEIKYATIGSEITLEKLKEIKANAVNSDATIDANTKYVKVSDDTLSNTPIYVWFENNKLYWFSEDDTPSMNADASYMFSNMRNTTEIPELNKMDTSNVTNMSYMFNGCRGLTSINVSGFDTKNVTDMSYMFSFCSRLTSLDVSGFNTENVTNMSNMFSSCNVLTSLDVSGFNTENVTNMSDMFSSCNVLTSLDVSRFDTKNVTTMSSMFSGCNLLTSLDFRNFNTSNVTDMSYMFSYCRGLTSLDVSGFNTSKVTKMSGMFNNCYELTNLDVSGFNTKKVTNMSNMFDGCEKLKTIYATDSFVVNNGTTTTNMFRDCSVLEGGNGTKFSEAGVTDGSYAWIDGKLDSNGVAQPGYFTNHFYIEFNANDGTQEPATAKQGIPVGHATPLNDGNTLFTKEGFTITGWNTKADGTGTSYTNKQAVTDLVAFGETLTLYAQWDANTYTIKFNANGGTGTMADLPMTYGTPANLTTNGFSRTGYSFVKWTVNADGTGEDYTNGEEVNNLTAENGATVNLYAQWQARTFTLTVNAGSGTILSTSGWTLGSGDTTATKQVTYDSAYGTLPTPTRTGYTFGGWYTGTNGTGSRITEETVYTTNGPKTLYAKWNGISYIIRFNATGGTGTMADLSMTYGTTKNLTPNAFSKTGYQFLGWATTEGGEVVYTDSYAVSNLTAIDGATVNLYAVWKDIEVPKWYSTFLDITNIY